jgi:hypothetical protein
MSASTTQLVVRKQLCAMGCQLFEMGVLRIDGWMLLRSRWSADQIDAAIAWLRRENARRAHIFVRPHGAHALSLVDDLSAENDPANDGCRISASRGYRDFASNFQVWLNALHRRRHLQLPSKSRYDPSLSFRGILATAGICIGRIWRGLYTQQTAAFQNSKSGPKYCRRETCQKKADGHDRSTMRRDPQSKRSALSGRSIELAASPTMWRKINRRLSRSLHIASVVQVIE